MTYFDEESVTTDWETLTFSVKIKGVINVVSYLGMIPYGRVRLWLFTFLVRRIFRGNLMSQVIKEKKWDMR